MDLRKQVQESFWNPKRGYANRTAYYVAEFNRRRQLKEIGFSSSLSDLDALSGELFIEIADEIGRLEEQKRERDLKRKGK